MKKVKYVGHIVSEHGIETDPGKTEKVLNWPKPTTPEEVRQFIGFVGYYRRFIPNFSQTSRPLTLLMPTPRSTNKRKSKQQDKAKWKWGPEQDTAFENLKKALASPPILGYANYSLPFELHTDASQLGLGAVLYQSQQGQKRVISYASRGLSKAERNYPVHKLEFLALKWAITEKFHDYLYGNTFTVYTDNNPLTYVLSSTKLDATGHRWLASLSNYSFKIVYRPGKTAADADGLSRLKNNESASSNREEISSDSLHAIRHAVQAVPYVECLSINTDVLDQSQQQPTSLNIDWKAGQDSDVVLREWKKHVYSGVKLKTDQLPPTLDSYALLRNFQHLHIENGVLYRKTTIVDQERNQLVLPRAYVNHALEELHNKFGHPGRERTYSLIRDRFYWNGMFKDIDNWIKACHRCLRRKVPTNQRAELVNIETTYPLELVCMDYLSLEESKGGYPYILVITDHFTRFAQAIPTRNQTARTTAEAFYHHFITYYGIPTRIHTDQGANFEGKLMRELCNITGMTKSRTTPYHPMGNGVCERFNRSLLDMLGTLQPTLKSNWKAHVGPLVHAYNCTRHESTGQSPYFLMFGREPRLPIDLAFGINQPEQKNMTKYVTELREKIKRAYDIACTSSEKAKRKQKEGYDLKARGNDIMVGDRVLVKIVAFDGKHKIQDRWEDEPYIVLKQPNPSIPVYVVQKESKEGRKRVLHRNLLLPIGYIDSDQRKEPIKQDKLAKPKPIPKPRKVNATKPNKVQNEEAESWRESDTNSDEEIEVPVPQMPADNVPHDVDSDAEQEEDITRESGHETVGEDGLVPDGQAQATPAEDIEDGSGEDNPVSDEPSDDEPSTLQEDEQPRRSARQRQEPHWMRSDEYILQSVKSEDAWKEKVQYLHSLLCQCKGSQRDMILDTMLKIIQE